MIVSGGQTGVDRAALDWACGHRIPHGGWCPMGRRAEDGPLPWKYQMRMTESSDYRPRTEYNVRDSDGTLILNLGKLNSGTLATQSFAQKMNKPCLLVLLDSGVSREAVASIHAWLREHRFKSLNVAGPRQSKRPGIYRMSFDLLETVLSRCRHSL
ncbi:MAG: putative molybdenum carrier protein [Candidatus Accumulibacter sp.]|nr:putative molybdenum carrier protein [Accumulibacter sp.]